MTERQVLHLALRALMHAEKATFAQEGSRLLVTQAKEAVAELLDKDRDERNEQTAT